MPYSRPWTTNRCRWSPFQPNAICNTACRPAIGVAVGDGDRVVAGGAADRGHLGLPLGFGGVGGGVDAGVHRGMDALGVSAHRRLAVVSEQDGLPEREPAGEVAGPLLRGIRAAARRAALSARASARSCCRSALSASMSVVPRRPASIVTVTVWPAARSFCAVSAIRAVRGAVSRERGTYQAPRWVDQRQQRPSVLRTRLVPSPFAVPCSRVPSAGVWVMVIIGCLSWWVGRWMGRGSGTAVGITSFAG